MSPDEDKLTGKIDLIICLGGDGTLLYASTLFQVEIDFLSASLKSYCHTACNIISYRHDDVTSPLTVGPSVCLSTRLSVMLCTVAK